MTQIKGDRLEQVIPKFHDTIDTIEVNKQLQGVLAAEVLTPSTVEYELKERAMVAKLYFMSLDNLDEGQVLQVCVKLVRNLIKLCNRREPPTQYLASRSRKQIYEHIEGIHKPSNALLRDNAITDAQKLPESTAL